MDELAAYEGRLRRAGLPLLIEDYSAYEDIFTRAVPLLALVFGFQLLGAVKLDWPLWANVLSLAGGLAILLGSLAFANRRRGRPAMSIPDRVGPAELGGFVLIPALLPVMFGGQFVSAIVTAAGNAFLLALIYGIVGVGLLSILRWAGRRVVAQLAASLVLLTRAVPVLLVFMILLFLTTEVWQVFSDISDAKLAGVVVLFGALGSIFVAARLPNEVRDLERDVKVDPPLRRRQRFNVGLVMFVSQGLQVLVVSLIVGLFFVAFGVLALTPHVIEEWIQVPPHKVLGQSWLSVELLKVSGALAAFSGLYYAISVLTEGAYRKEFLDDVETSLRETFVDRAHYLDLRAEREAA
jgi:amino acid transporter